MPFLVPRRPRMLRGAFLAAPVVAEPIVTSRLVLRPHRLADAEAWFRLQSDPEVVRYLSWPLRDRAESLQHLRGRTRRTRLWQAEDFLALAVEHDGELIGDVSLRLLSVAADTRTAEVAWIIGPAFAGRGFATEAAEAVLNLAFDQLGAVLVLAAIDESNAASLVVAGKLSFAPAGLVGSTTTFSLAAASR